MKAYVVFCHPQRDSFTGAEYDRVLAGLASAGHEVRTSDLYADGFQPELSLHDKTVHLVDHREHPELRPDILPYVEHLRWCDTLVLVYPTWWSGHPAMLKGWFDRVWVQGVAWELPEGANRIRPLLRNIHRIVSVTSHGSTKWVNAIEGETGKRLSHRAIRLACGLATRSTWIAFYKIDRRSRAECDAFLAKVERRVASL